MLIVKPRKAPKTSSKGAAALKALENATSISEQLRILFRLDAFLGFPELDQAELHRFYTWRRELLLDVANLRDDGFDWFYRKWAQRFFRGKNVPSKPEVIKLRNELRQVWAPTIEHKQNQRIVSSWFHWRPSLPSAQLENTSGKIDDVAMWEPVLKTGNVVPVVGSLHAQLVQGVLEQYGRFAICENPACPAGFFLSKRYDQKYCERGECTAYAQRMYALGWWNREGKALRKRKAKKKSGHNRRGR